MLMLHGNERQTINTQRRQNSGSHVAETVKTEAIFIGGFFLFKCTLIIVCSKTNAANVIN